ncbi:hypothetical protein BH09CHL1_BH09CHL1_11570 [soil metagenome]
MFSSTENRAVSPLGENRPGGEARTDRRARSARRLAALGLTLALTGGILGSAIASPSAFAVRQDSKTPTPSAAACRTVLQGDQTTSSLTDITQFVPVSGLGNTAATPAATQTATATATPRATVSAATPIPADSSVSDIAGAETLRSLAFSIVNCTSQGDFAALGELVTTNYLSETFAGGDKLSRTDLLALAAVTVVPQQSLIAFDNVEVGADTGTAEVIYTSGSQLLHQQWHFITDEKSGDWVLDNQTSLDPLALEGSVTTNVTINKGIKTDPREVVGGNVVLLGENTEKVDHEMLVLRLPSGTSTDLLLQQPGPGLPDGVQFIGQMTVPANGEAILPLINLAPGNYVVVCMLLDDNGAPYLADGYKARLIVQ